MSFRGLVMGALIWASPAIASSIPEGEIREVEIASTDVFEIFTILQHAQMALADRDYLAARQGFETVLFHDANIAEARFGLRRTLMGLGDMKSASELLDEKNSPDGILIAVYLQQTENPIEFLTQALKTHADSRLWTLLGRLHDAKQQFGPARQAYAMAGLAGSRPGLADNNIGQSHWLAGEYQLASESFARAVKANPQDMQFDNNRRRSLIRLGKTSEAISGLHADRAGIFLSKAADQAVADNEIKLAKILYRKSMDLSPRHNPKTAEKLSHLGN